MGITRKDFERWKSINLDRVKELSVDDAWRVFYIEESNRILNEEMEISYAKGLVGSSGGSVFMNNGTFDYSFDYTF